MPLATAPWAYLCTFQDVASKQVVGGHVAESLWSRLKTEVLDPREWPVFADLSDARACITAYFDYYYHERLPSGIGYQTPYHTH